MRKSQLWHVKSLVATFPPNHTSQLNSNVLLYEVTLIIPLYFSIQIPELFLYKAILYWVNIKWFEEHSLLVRPWPWKEMLKYWPQKNRSYMYVSVFLCRSCINWTSAWKTSFVRKPDYCNHTFLWFSHWLQLEARVWKVWAVKAFRVAWAAWEKCWHTAPNFMCI